MGRTDILAPMPLPLPLVIAALIRCASAGVSLDPAHPPELVGRLADRPVYQFAPGAAWAVDDAVVLELAAGVSPPIGARALGGGFYRLPTRRPVETALAWQGRPGVVEAFPDVLLPHERRSFDDPSYGGQWYLQDLGMEALYAVSLGSPDVRVAVIDSGIDIAHPDLASAVVDPYDAWSDDDDPSPDPGEYCTNGSNTDICDEHGTATSGIILARANNGDGIVGMCPTCTLIPIKMLGEGAMGSSSADIAAFEHAIASDAAVISNSWGFTQYTPVPTTLANAIRHASTDTRGGLGAVVVFAAGNDDRELQADEMESMDEVVCVSATDSYGYPTAYTNYGEGVDVAAPSATVTIAPGDEVIVNFGGTSAAAPVVSGLLAWALSVDPTLSAAELRDLVRSTATPSPYIPPTDHDPYYGYGNLSAAGVLEALVPSGDTGDTGESPGVGGCACGQASGALGGWVFGLVGLFAVRRRA